MADESLNCFKSHNATQNVGLLWTQLQGILAPDDHTKNAKDAILLRTSEALQAKDPDKGNEVKIAKDPTFGSVLVSTGTALGALRQTLDKHSILFILGDDEADRFRARNDAVKCENFNDFYLKDAVSKIPGKESPKLEALWDEFYDIPYVTGNKAQE